MNFIYGGKHQGATTSLQPRFYGVDVIKICGNILIYEFSKLFKFNNAFLPNDLETCLLVNSILLNICMIEYTMAT